MNFITKRFIKKTMVITILLIFFLSYLNILVSANDQKSDLIIESIDYEENVYEDKETTIVVKIKNDGNKNITDETFEIHLFFDGLTQVATNSSYSSLEIGEAMYLNISWTPELGDEQEHVLKVYINYNELIDESDYDNNIISFHVKMNKKQTDLEIYDSEIPEILFLNQTTNIQAKIINNGKKTGKSISAFLSSNVEGEIQKKETIGLDYKEIYEFKFDWTPEKIGVQNLEIKVYLDDDLHDTLKASVRVTIGEYEWWNENWHYRYVLALNGEGNFSKSLNFTNILNDIGLKNYSFENDTIKIVKYSNNGEIVGNIINYSFNKTENYNKSINAAGDLKWFIPSQDNISIFIIYFDVEENIGLRTKTNEKNITNLSTDITTIYDDVYESWYAFFSYPTDSSIILVNESIKINVSSVAKIESANGFSYHNTGNNFSFNLDNISKNQNFVNDSIKFDEQGNWTINISCVDSAGVFYNFSQLVYVGQPDLRIEEIDIRLEDGSKPKDYFRNDSINISVKIKSIFLSFENINVNLSFIEYGTDKIIHYENIISNFSKDQIKTLYFTWKASISGRFNISVFVDSDDIISEINETNNKEKREINIYELPDLFVKNLIMPSFEIKQFDKVRFDVLISNKGYSRAKDYKIGLFIEKKSGSNPIMRFNNEVDYKIFSISENSNKTISLYWNKSLPGNWYVGVKIYYDQNKRDIFPLNNYFLSEKTLVVNSEELNLPTIKDIKINPSIIRLGDIVEIIAYISDESGLDNVNITINSPTDKQTNDNMYRINDNYFKYNFIGFDEIGTYRIVISAVDKSLNSNIKKINRTFFVDYDNIDPEIFNAWADPFVQLKNKDIDFICIADDNVGVNDVEIRINNTDNTIVKYDLEKKDNRYIFTKTFNNTGKYKYTIKVTDTSYNYVEKNGIFWITADLNDSDSDDIPDEWEEEYNLDKYNSSDAGQDFDDDGYSNYDEYKMQTNPRKNIFTQNIAANIRLNNNYLIIAIALFIIILIIAYIGKKRVIA